MYLDLIYSIYLFFKDQVDHFLKCLNKECVNADIDLELTNGKDYDDTVDSFQELIQDLVKFIISCLNSRKTGIAIFGTTYDHVLRLSGLPFCYEKLQNIVELIEKEMKNRVSQRNFEGGLQLVDNVSVFQHMYKIRVCDISHNLVLIATVLPNPQLCGNHLFAFYVNRKPVIYCRKDGLLAELKGSLLQEAQSKLNFQ